MNTNRWLALGGLISSTYDTTPSIYTSDRGLDVYTDCYARGRDKISVLYHVSHGTRVFIDISRDLANRYGFNKWDEVPGRTYLNLPGWVVLKNAWMDVYD